MLGSGNSRAAVGTRTCFPQPGMLRSRQQPFTKPLSAPCTARRVSAISVVNTAMPKRDVRRNAVKPQSVPREASVDEAQRTAPPPQPAAPSGPSPNEEKKVPEQLKPAVPDVLQKERSFTAVAADKAFDTLDDIWMHFRRNYLPAPQRALNMVRGRGGRMRLQSKKPIVLLLGSGWGAHSCMKVIDADAYEVVCVSPRNHFMFTPMLPSTAVGTIEFRSLLEPVRSSNPYVNYLEATCDQLDLNRKVAFCTSAVESQTGELPTFEIPYDVVVVSVGEQPATFGVPGVYEHAYFMKEVSDCVGLRKRINECFELASLPGISEEQKENILHFVVVGGGPTGVEFAGTLGDFVYGDLSRKYAGLMKYVKVTLLQSGQSILTTFASSLQARAMENFEKRGVNVRTGVRVVELKNDCVVLSGGENVPCGVCVWSTGNATRPLVSSIVQQIDQQVAMQQGVNPKALKLVVDPYLRVVGAEDVIAIGDCSSRYGNRLPSTAQVAGQQGAYVARMINRGYVVGHGNLEGMPPIKYATNSYASRSSMSASRDSHDDAASDRKVEEIYVGKGRKVLGDPTMYPSRTPLTGGWAGGELGLMRFNDEVRGVDSRVQQYKHFEFLSLGIMAYIGGDRALTQVEAFDTSLKLHGYGAFLLWRSVYITKQVSFRNRVLILFDWMKTRVFGRDISQF